VLILLLHDDISGSTEGQLLGGLADERGHPVH
jgi:hypothetical protein